VALTAALAFGAAFAQGSTSAPTFSDVPAGFWAAAAVNQLAADGILLGFPDGTFRGNQPLTRYQAAELIQRVLQYIAAGKLHLNSQQLSTLQKAVQELSANLAALGVRVSNLEANSVSKAEFDALSSKVSNLQSELQSGMGQMHTQMQQLMRQMQKRVPGASTQAMTDLSNQVEAASITADSALAKSQALQSKVNALNGKVSKLQSELGALGKKVATNAANIASLNNLTVLLNQDILNLQQRVGALESQKAPSAPNLSQYVTKSQLSSQMSQYATQGELSQYATQGELSQYATQGDLSSLRAFDTVTRNEVTALQGQVKTLQGQVNGILTGPQYSVSGTLSATYGQIGLTKGTTEFSSGRLFPNDNFSPSLSATDTAQTFTGGSASVTFGLKNLNIANSGVTVTSASATANIGTTFPSPAAGSTAAASPMVTLSNVTVNGTANKSNFSINYNDGATNESNFSFNPYLFNNNIDTNTQRQGVVAMFTAGDLPFAPSLEFVTGTSYPYDLSSSYVVPLYGSYYGVRAVVHPGGMNNSLGLSYAQDYLPASSAAAGYALNNRDAGGVDGNFNVGPVNLSGLYIASFAQGSGVNNGAGYVMANVKLGGLTLSGNFRAIDPTYGNGVASMSNNASYYDGGLSSGNDPGAPFGSNEVGYGASLSGNLSIFSVDAYFRSFSNYSPTTNSNFINPSVNFVQQTAYGVSLNANLFRGFSLGGFYDSASVGGSQATQLFGNNPGLNYNAGGSIYDNNYNTYGYATGVDQQNSSNFGLAIAHNGSAANALIPNLNLGLTYIRFYDDNPNVAAYTLGDLQAYASYDLNVGALTLQPIVRYHSFTNPNGGEAVAANPYSSMASFSGFTNEPYSFNTLKFGVALSTKPLSLPLSPSFNAAIYDRNTNFLTPGSTPASELYYTAGITLNNFFSPASVLSAAYAYYSGSGLSSDFSTGNGNNYANATGAGEGYIYNTPGGFLATPSSFPYSGNENGIYLNYGYLGFTTSYGLFFFNDTSTGNSSIAQAFRVAYSLNF
jgi:hypothetical protein